MFVKANDLLLLFPEKKNEPYFGFGPGWHSSCPNRFLKKQLLKVLIFFFRTTTL